MLDQSWPSEDGKGLGSQTAFAPTADAVARIPKAAEPRRVRVRRSLRLLLVERDTALRRFKVQTLVRSGYRVQVVEAAGAAWEAVRDDKFDLLICDNDLPKSSGLELVKRLRCARRTLPIVLTASALTDAGLDRHPWFQIAATMLRPFSPEELLGTVQGVLRGGHRARFERVPPSGPVAD